MEVIVMIIARDRTVLDEFTVIEDGNPECTAVMLAAAVRERLETKFNVSDTDC